MLLSVCRVRPGRGEEEDVKLENPKRAVFIYQPRANHSESHIFLLAAGLCVALLTSLSLFTSGGL